MCLDVWEPQENDTKQLRQHIDFLHKENAIMSQKLDKVAEDGKISMDEIRAMNDKIDSVLSSLQKVRQDSTVVAARLERLCAS